MPGPPTRAFFAWWGGRMRRRVEGPDDACSRTCSFREFSRSSKSHHEGTEARRKPKICDGGMGAQRKPKICHGGMEARRSYASDDSPDHPITCDPPITRSQYLCHRERTGAPTRLLPNLLRSSAGTSG